jgi:hypothetical protein
VVGGLVIGLVCIQEGEGVHLDAQEVLLGLVDDAAVVGDLVILGGDEEDVQVLVLARTGGLEDGVVLLSCLYVADEKVFRRLMDEEETFLKISPILFFEILLRKSAQDLEMAKYTVEKSRTMKIPIFDTQEVVELLNRETCCFILRICFRPSPGWKVIALLSGSERESGKGSGLTTWIFSIFRNIM